MLNRYVFKNGKKLRCGYTTGSCAVAAGVAATKMLFEKITYDVISITTNNGTKLMLDIHDIKVNPSFVACSVTKDSGDDPDITNGIKIFAKARESDVKGIKITGGKGIGVVTKKGLPVEVGKAAINPGPIENIRSEVSKVLPQDKGVEIEFSIPEGENIAKKTFNPKLGIVGGISIIGTTGIVEPMSEDALKESLALELSVLKGEGVQNVIFSPGNYGRNFSRELGLKEEVHIKTSNYIGFMLDKALEYEFKRILWVGHIGKMIKVAGGIFNTHSKHADARMEILAAHCINADIPVHICKKVLRSITTDEAIEYIKESKNEMVFQNIAHKISQQCSNRVNHEIELGTIIFSNVHGLLGACPNGKQWIEAFGNE
ncbi:MAG: cobalt-precorrin-5B (C(1))-methyltransferase CbiD [Clostridia bacterium]|nr:cobalt-precorrin-5B (C(1))-methyltransferase CbiD [Clostridia bacterium]